MQDICVQSLGLVDYRAALEQQELWRQNVLSGTCGAVLLCVEHPKTVTLGKNARSENLLLSEKDYASRQIELIATERGGDVTAHEPGQAIIYPIVSFTSFKLSPKTYVRLLEESIISWLKTYDLNAGVDAINPGVWIDGEKIAAIGIRIKDRVSMHGLALNVRNDLSTFATVTPCGIATRGVTSLSKLFGTSAPTVDEAHRGVANEISRRLSSLKN